MILDASTAFTSIAGDAVTANGTSSFIVDFGAGGGLSAAAKYSAKLLVLVTQAFNNLTSLNVALQGAPDNGSGAPGTFATIYESGAVPLSKLTAQAKVLQGPLQGVLQGWNTAPPRFLQLAYTIAGTAPTTGKLLGALVEDIDISAPYPSASVVTN
jgi:hypothetical protein